MPFSEPGTVILFGQYLLLC